MGMSEVQDKGFVTTSVDTIVNWARTSWSKLAAEALKARLPSN